MRVNKEKQNIHKMRNDKINVKTILSWNIFGGKIEQKLKKRV